VRNPLTGQWKGTASLETVPVGNAGNAADMADGDVNTAGVQHYGRVNYAYNIGKYEVTAGQYNDFLNVVAGVDTYGLYNTSMWSDTMGCKIERFAGSGTTDSPYQYRVAADRANRPVNYVSFWDSCRFANWLNNGQGGAGTTEYGAYTLTDTVGITNNTITRNGGATWVVTSEDEWYKAAYYDSNKNGVGPGYWLLPTKSDTTPGREMADPRPGNSDANYYPGTGAFPLDNPYYTTVAGEFQDSASALGTFDQGGNVSEWTEAIFAGTDRWMRGGSFHSYGSTMESGFRSGPYAAFEHATIGFRVSQVPEPASLGVLGVAVVGMLVRRRGLRR
jgi:formylglycine-generating enzyme